VFLKLEQQPAEPTRVAEIDGFALGIGSILREAGQG
jgi:hypothetical protein